MLVLHEKGVAGNHGTIVAPCAPDASVKIKQKFQASDCCQGSLRALLARITSGIATDALMLVNKGQRSRLWIRQGLSLDAQQR